LRLPKICDKKVGHARADRAGAVERLIISRTGLIVEQVKFAP